MEILIPWMIATVIGLPIALWLIKTGKKHEWFSSYHFISHKELIAQLDEFFKGRISLSDEDYYVQYFQLQGIPKEIPIRVRKIFEDMFEADFSRIKNTDDFSEEMKFIWGYDSMIDVEIVMEIEDEFGIKFENEEAEKMRSIQDIVIGVWNKTKNLPNQRIEPTAVTPV